MKPAIKAGLCAGLFFAFACRNSEVRAVDFGRDISPEALKAHLEFLSDDSLEGRRTGTRGYDIAAKYLAAQFSAGGLTGGMPDGSFFQNAPFRRGDVVPETTSLTFGPKDRATVLRPGSDFLLLHTQLRPGGEITAPVVFIGYGVTDPELGYDDYAGLDVKGKFVALLSQDAPTEFTTDARAYYTLFEVRRAIAAEHGAVAILGIRTPQIESRFSWSFRQRGLATGFGIMGWLDDQGRVGGLDERPGPWADLNRSAAEMLFDQEAHTLAEVFASAERGTPLRFPLKKTATLRYESRHTEVRSANVVAKLAGADPVLKDEYVVFTTHLDHLGIGPALDGDPIYNGAMDNASGCAHMLEIAKAFQSLPARPRRSILFVAMTGEEQGKLGSDYFASFPPVPRSAIIAAVNLDGSIGTFPVRDAIVFGQAHSSLGRTAEQASAESGFIISPEPQPERGLFVRSDHFSFVRAGVPGVFLSPGYRSSDPGIDGLKAFLDWAMSAYHMPGDDARRTFDYVAGARFARFAGWLTYKIAMEDDRPAWMEGDFFGRKFGHSR